MKKVLSSAKLVPRDTDAHKQQLKSVNHKTLGFHSIVQQDNLVIPSVFQDTIPTRMLRTRLQTALSVQPVTSVNSTMNVASSITQHAILV